MANLGPDLAAGVTVSDIPDGGMKTGHIGGTKALLARIGDEVFAIGATCSHLGGPLHQGLVGIINRRKQKKWLLSQPNM